MISVHKAFIRSVSLLVAIMAIMPYDDNQDDHDKDCDDHDYDYHNLDQNHDYCYNHSDHDHDAHVVTHQNIIISKSNFHKII